MIFSWLRNRRRRKILATPFPDQWMAYLQRNVAHYPHLTPDDQARLRDDLHVFVAEKNWEGCGGLELTDEMKVTVAAQACLMALGLDGDPFGKILSILVYPSGYAVPEQNWHGGLSIKGESARLGESWYRGPVILSWDEVRHDARRPGCGQNLVWHEFAHQLDMLDRTTNGTPPLANRQLRRRWAEVMTAEYRQLVDDAREGRATLLDTYGAQDEAEFFAVVSECFFDCPVELRDEHPRLYDLLREYYRQDPATRMQEVP